MGKVVFDCTAGVSGPTEGKSGLGEIIGRRGEESISNQD